MPCLSQSPKIKHHVVASARELLQATPCTVKSFQLHGFAAFTNSFPATPSAGAGQILGVAVTRAHLTLKDKVDLPQYLSEPQTSVSVFHCNCSFLTK